MNSHRAKQLHRIALVLAEKEKAKMPQWMKFDQWKERILQSVSRTYHRIPRPQRRKWLAFYPASVNPNFRKA